MSQLMPRSKSLDRCSVSHELLCEDPQEPAADGRGSRRRSCEFSAPFADRLIGTVSSDIENPLSVLPEASSSFGFPTEDSVSIGMATLCITRRNSAEQVDQTADVTSPSDATNVTHHPAQIPCPQISRSASVAQLQPRNEFSPVGENSGDGNKERVSGVRDPLRLSRFLVFPIQTGEHGAEIHLYDGMVNHNFHDIKLTRAGYYALRLHNQNEPAWDSLYLGIGRMKIIADFQVTRPALLHSDSLVEVSGSTAHQTQDTGLSAVTPAAQAQYPVVEESKALVHDSKGLGLVPEDAVVPPYPDNRCPDMPRRQTVVISSNEHNGFPASVNLPSSALSKTVATLKGRAGGEDAASCVDVIEPEFPSHLKHMAEAIEVIIGKGQLVAKSGQEKIIYVFVQEADSLLKLHVYCSLTFGMRLKCSYDWLYCGAPCLAPLNPHLPFVRKPNILCLDGGGVLGISSLKILERLELEIQKYLNNSSVRLVDCFDMICGTSTGGIISLGLLTGMSIQAMIHMWASMSGRIFEGHRTLFSGIFFEGYDIERLKTALAQSLGKRFLNSYRYPYCFVTTTNVKHNPYELFLLRNYTHHHLASNEHRGASAVPVWTAAWASSAAPTYLKGPNPQELESMGFIIHPEVQLCDGAMKANNPTMVALEEAARLAGKRLQHFIHSDLGILVSVGTGQPTLKQTIDRTGSVSTFQILVNSAHLLTSATTVHREVLHWLDDYEDQYFRFNVPGIGDTPLDSCSKSSYDIIIKATNDYLTDEKYYDVKRLVRQLAAGLG